MAELLLELFTEEIPARMQAQAADDLRTRAVRAMTEGLLPFESAESFSTPRRLTLIFQGLGAAQPEIVEERRGPRVGAPDAAVQGFLKGAGLDSLDACVQRDTGKGVFWFAQISRPGRPTAEVLPTLLARTIAEFPWPKSMRWSDGALRWVRPLGRILCLYDGRVLPVPVEGVETVDFTSGHRFLAPERVRVSDAAHYRTELARRHVQLDRAARRRDIADGAATLAAAHQVRLLPDEGLLEEVTGLVETPFLRIGSIDPDFMGLPAEVLTTSMRSHQKYFACRAPEGEALAPRFVFVANVPGDDGGATIVAGNERVLRARLSDARFFWEQDRKVRLENRLPSLAQRIFHAKLGTVLEKVQRVAALIPALGPAIPGLIVPDALRAARLAKADLSSGMVGEFPELQGVMGRYYALGEGEPASVADAIAEHYAPAGPNDRCPTAPVSVAVALADRIDSLVAFFSIGERPTGSKDPFALRRAALGIIRLILENGLRLPLAPVLALAAAAFPAAPAGLVGEVIAFMADRLKVDLKSEGLRHDLILAALSRGAGETGKDEAGEDDFVRLVARAKALSGFVTSPAGADLLVAYRRAANIVRIEERKDARSYDGPANLALFDGPEETTLAAALTSARARADQAVAAEGFAEAMAAMAALRDPVDAFFDRVTVNTDDPARRVNRLALLSQIRGTLDGVADFSKIEG